MVPYKFSTIIRLFGAFYTMLFVLHALPSNIDADENEPQKDDMIAIMPLSITDRELEQKTIEGRRKIATRISKRFKRYFPDSGYTYQVEEDLEGDLCSESECRELCGDSYKFVLSGELTEKDSRIVLNLKLHHCEEDGITIGNEYVIKGKWHLLNRDITKYRKQIISIYRRHFKRYLSGKYKEDFATIYVKPDPPKAFVIVNGKEYTKPQEGIKIKKGEVEILVRLERHDDCKMDIEVYEDKEIACVLEPTWAELDVRIETESGETKKGEGAIRFDRERKIEGLESEVFDFDIDKGDTITRKIEPVSDCYVSLPEYLEVDLKRGDKKQVNFKLGRRIEKVDVEIDKDKWGEIKEIKVGAKDEKLRKSSNIYENGIARLWVCEERILVEAELGYIERNLEMGEIGNGRLEIKLLPIWLIHEALCTQENHYDSCLELAKYHEREGREKQANQIYKKVCNSEEDKKGDACLKIEAFERGQKRKKKANRYTAAGAILLGVGNLSVIQGVLWGAIALRNYNELRDSCGKTIIGCEGRNYDSVEKPAIVSDVLLPFGGVTLVTGIILMAIGKKMKDGKVLSLSPGKLPNEEVK